MSNLNDVVVMQGDVVVNGDVAMAGVVAAASGGSEVVVEARPKSELPKDWPAQAVLQADGSAIIKLDYPVRFKMRETDGTIRPGDTYESLHLYRLKGKHKQALIVALRKDGVEVEKALLSASTGLDVGKTEMLYNEMDQGDITAALTVINVFTGRGRGLGLAS